MQELNVTPTIVQQKIMILPKSHLQEVNDFIDFILMRTKGQPAKRVRKLEGIWEGLGFERIPDIEASIRDIRQDSEEAILGRIDRCSL